MKYKGDIKAGMLIHSDKYLGGHGDMTVPIINKK